MSLEDVRLIDLPHVPDERGVLTSIESGRDVPFEIRRIFFMHDIRASRGGHAHRVTRQLVVPVSGEFRIQISDGVRFASYSMNNRNQGLYLPPLTWAQFCEFSASAVCLVLADTHYDESSYIRDWNDFVGQVSSQGPF
jgi:dTDP-4-dehydrorhamnose 3,5-epimerase-like enzyme